MALGESPARGRAMEIEKHRYAPIDTTHSEGQYVDSKGPSMNGSNGDSGDTSRSDGRPPHGNEHALMKDTFYLDHVGQVIVTLSNTHFVWTSTEDAIQELDASTLLCCRTILKDTEGHLPVAEIFAVKALDVGPVNQIKSSMFGGSLAPKQLRRVEVHTFLRSDGKWVPKVYVFGHTSEAVVQEWTQRIQALLHEDSHRPKSLLVFINPHGGKGSGVPTWKQVSPLFELAKIKVTVITTERAGHARDVMNRATKDELNALDGVIVVGGDGFFNEVVNGLIMHRHKAPTAIMPQRLNSFYKERTLLQQRNSKATVISNEQGGLKQLVVGDVNTSPENSSDQHPLLQNRPLPSLSEATIGQKGKDVSSGEDTSTSGVASKGLDTALSPAKVVQVRESELREQADVDSSGYTSISLTVPVQDEQGNFLQPTIATAGPIIGTVREGDATRSAGASFSDIELENPNTSLVDSNPNLRIGIIPAGSTDTVVISTTGSRDPFTSALHIILGDRMPLDIVRITGWRKQREDSASELPEVRYAASFAGYGFYGDVMRESEDLRWMGPARYDMAGFKVFMQHKSYEAEISFLDIPHNQSEPLTVIPQGPWSRNSSFKSRHDDKKKIVCLAHCAVCASGFDFSHVLNSESDTEGSQHMRGMQAPNWRTIHTKFHSIGAAVMSCRNDKAPEGVAAHAHLADGLLHLILIRECSRPEYLRQLLRLARRGADPFNFSFVDYYKTPLFTFTTRGVKESVWSVDGELLLAQELTGQVFRGLVNLFARGPET